VEKDKELFSPLAFFILKKTGEEVIG